MNRFFSHRDAAAWPWLFVALMLLALGASAPAATPKAAQVTQVIKDVKLLPPQAAPRAANVSETVASGTGLRTGAESRAELTFTDLTITRLGANTVFSFNEGARELNLDSGAILVQVPKGGAAAQVSTAGFTCAVTGGTALCEVNKGAPSKVMILEGSGHFCATAGGCVDIPPGEMVVMTPDGRFTQPFKFNVALVMETALLITDFPPLPNLYLIAQVILQQAASASSPWSTPPTGTINATSQRFATGTPPPASPGTPNKFGPPATITSPNPYVISNGTAIQTDPTITTNGVTDLGKIYRGQAVDGPFSAFAFGSTSSFDTVSGFDADIGNGSGGGNGRGAGFKFTALQLTGDPVVSTLNGEINLGLIAVNSITSSGPGGNLTFAGIRGLLFATQNGPITLGPEISFSGQHDINFYARGSGSDLTLGSQISTTSKIHLYAQGNIQVNGDESTDEFRAFSGGDFILAGSGSVMAASLDVQSLGNIDIDASRIPDVAGGSISLNAAGTLHLAVSGGTYGRNSLTAVGSTINITSDTPVTLDFASATVVITAGSGGLTVSDVDIVYQDLIMQSAGAISLGSITFGAGHFNASISAGTSFFASGDVNAATLTAGTTVDVGGQLFVEDTLTAGGNINVGTLLQALNINAPNGVLTVGMGIHPVIISTSQAALQHTFNVASIVSPVGIDFNGNQFGLVNGVSPGGRLTINANNITFDPNTGIGPTNFSGSDSGGTTANGGDGGILIVNTTGDINATNSDIMATTGINAPPGSPAGPFGGAGGTVTLTSSGGAVTISDKIEVSSDSTTTQRQSASGGNISISSGKASGVAINVTNSGQLLALLNNAAPGPGGTITVQATGASSQANVSGTVTASRGTIDIRHTGGSGQINVSGATMLADIIKIGALGTNGTLTIGGGMISADSLLRLYAPSSNGTLNFISNVTLSSGTAMDLAANTITIQPAVLVTIAGAGGPANIYTNNANYSGFNGSNPANGTFGGNGANSPQPLSAAPPLGPAPQISSPSRHGRNH